MNVKAYSINQSPNSTLVQKQDYRFPYQPPDGQKVARSDILRLSLILRYTKMAATAEVEWASCVKPLLSASYSSFNKNNIPDLVESIIKR